MHATPTYPPAHPREPERVNTLDTQSAALHRMGFKALSASLAAVFDVVVAGHRSGASDMSLTEIRDLYERMHGKRIDLNRVSARVSNLVTSGRLMRKQAPRPCSVTKHAVHPVFAPAQQQSIC